MHGTGNDYVYVDLFRDGPVKDAASMAIAVSHRHFGIGADGLILIAPTAEAHAEMIMYNADGSQSEMCGNGLRCVAKFVYDHKLADTKELRIKTGAGIKSAWITAGVDGKAESIRLDMGAPILQAKAIPTTWESANVVWQPLTIDDRTFEVTCVSMGNPHCVIYVDDVASFPVHHYGPLIENHPNFPKRVNVEFVQVVSPQELIQRTWERGSGETWACGTGASAVCVAGTLTKKSDPRVTIHLLGGDLQLDYANEQTVYLTGPAVEVFQGEWV